MLTFVTRFRSREKRRISDMVLETRVMELTRENALLRTELYAIKEKFGMSQTQHFIDPDTVSLPLPESACRGRRNKLLSTIITGNSFTGKKLPAKVIFLSKNALLITLHLAHSPSRSTGSDQGQAQSLANYVSASSPQSSSSSLSDSAAPLLSHSLHHSGSLNTNSPHSLVSSPPSSITMGLDSPVAHINHSLPHKLRHKARNTANDSDSGSDCNGIGSTPDGPGDLPIEEAKQSNTTGDLHLKQENYELHKQLQRLASEVASLKTYLVPSSNAGPPSESGSVEGERGPSPAISEKYIAIECDDRDRESKSRPERCEERISTSSERSFCEESERHPRDD